MTDPIGCYTGDSIVTGLDAWPQCSELVTAPAWAWWWGGTATTAALLLAACTGGVETMTEEPVAVEVFGNAHGGIPI